MKTPVPTNYYRLLLISNADAGFTLIELLVVIIIIGVLAVMGFNSFLNFAPRAKQSEAKTAVASINHAQSTYLLERAIFANDINQLSLGLPITTTNYNYIISGGSVAVATINADSINTALKSYAGAVEKHTDADNKIVSASVVCESAIAGNTIAPLTSGLPGTNACGTDKELGQ